MQSSESPLNKYKFPAQGGLFAERYAFVVEWLDGNSGITWKYQLLHFPETKEIEMVNDHDATAVQAVHFLWP